MDQDMITDITLDHLPDLSEESISFQIPNNNASADLLLADNDDPFGVLCHADGDYDISFAPVSLNHPRGPPLTLAELTPRVQRDQGTPRPSRHSPSPTPTQVPPPSAKPSVIQRALALGHGNPDKQTKTPRPKSVHRHLESPLVSSERFQLLCAEVETLGQADESPSHVRIHVMDSVEGGPAECSSSSHVNTVTKGDALKTPLASEEILDPIPEENDTPQDVVPPADHDVVMATGDSSPADATHVAASGRPPKSKRNPRTSSKSTVVAGGISKRTAFTKTHVSKKAKGKPSSGCVREAYPVTSSSSQPTPPQSIDSEDKLAPPASMNGDMDSNPESNQVTHPSTGGLAERLVSYSQKLMSSIGLYNSKLEHSSTEADVEDGPPVAVISPPLPPQCINDVPMANTHSEPFRLSEISPHKQHPHSMPASSANNETLQDGIQHAMSPMRPAKKRSTVDADRLQECQLRDRGHIMPAHGRFERGSSNEAVSQGPPRPAKRTRVHEDQSITHPETRDSTQHLASAKFTLPSARTKYRPPLTFSQCKGPTLHAFPYSSRSRQVHERLDKGRGKRDDRQSEPASLRSESSTRGFPAGSHWRLEKETRQESAIESSHSHQRSGPTSTVDLPLIEKRPHATLSVAQLTKPVGFTFRVDARLEARKTEERLAVSEPGKTHPFHSVPDVRAYRASHQAFTFHKDAAVPSVPVVPFIFCTEQRAKEREKFDEMVKRKEEEMQRLKEEQQQREVEEEERAIKELRRKAIPKANEIPEWYADMPKRKGTAV